MKEVDKQNHQETKKKGNYSHCYEGNMLMKKSQWRGRGGGCGRPPGEAVPGFRSRFHPNIPLHSTLTRASHAPTLSLVLVPHSFLSFCASHTWWQWYADMSIVPPGARVTRCVENDTMTWIFLSSYTLCGYFIDTEQGQMFCSSTSRLRVIAPQFCPGTFGMSGGIFRSW